MKCAACKHEGEVLKYNEREDDEKFIEIELNQLVGRKGLNTKYTFYACPKCGTVRMEFRC